MINHYLKIPEMCSTLSGVVLATVTDTDGSTPQKPGSHAVFLNGSLAEGTVGGGIVEGKVQTAAGIFCKTHDSVLMEYGLDNDISMKHDAICGGNIRILIDGDPGIHIAVFEAMKASLSADKPGVMVTGVYKEKGRVKIERYWITGEEDIPDNPLFQSIPKPELQAIIEVRDRELRSVSVKLPDQREALVIIEPLLPEKKLVIAGAGHVGKALSHVAKLLGFHVTVIDPRIEFANPDNLPDADLIKVGDIGTTMREMTIGSITFIVIVTRGHSDDAEALKACLGSDAAYIGMIGSRTKIARMKAEFIEKRWATEEQWKRIHAPIGLEIGSVTVEEIAVSIAAELVKVRNSDKQYLNRL
jgi:xanthine dehydrogenase accessory factor